MLTPLLISGVLVVAPTAGPGVDFTSVQAAIDAAADGDIVLIRSGSYAGAIAISGKSVTLVADAASAPVIAAGATVVVDQAPAGGFIALRGLRIDGVPYVAGAPDTGSTAVANCAGSVLVEDCVVGGTHSGVRANGVAWLALARSQLSGQATYKWGFFAVVGVALQCQGSLVTVHDSSLVAGQGFLGGMGATGFGVDGASGLRIESGKLYLARSDALGGDGAGSQIDGYQVCSYSVGGSGLVLGTGAPSVVDLGSTLTAGTTPPLQAPCNLETGEPPLKQLSGSYVAASGAAPILASSAVTREGQTLSLALDSRPGDFGVLLVAVSAQPVDVDAFGGVLVSPAATVLPLGSVQPSGVLGASAQIQELGAGVEGAVLFLQGASVDPTALSVRLSNVSVATLLDAGL